MQTVSEILNEISEQHARKLEMILAAQSSLERISEALKQVETLEIGKGINFSHSHYDDHWVCGFTGTKRAMEIVWKALRTEEYEPNERPADEPMAGFDTYFYKRKEVEFPDYDGVVTLTKVKDYDQLCIYFQFSSTECQLVVDESQPGELIPAFIAPKYKVVCNAEA